MTARASVPAKRPGRWCASAVLRFKLSLVRPAEAMSNVSERSRAAGSYSVLPKPFEIDDLLRMIAEAVSQSPFWSDA